MDAVNGERNDSNENETEAEFIASAILAARELEEYRDATFGVISLLGRLDAQSRLIASRLREQMDPAEFVRRRVLVGSPAHFQGDERDVMFLSLVDRPQEGRLRLQQADQFKKRLNVAASRAKDQMWVVHSLNPEIDLHPDDLRKQLILHAMSPVGISQQIEQQRAKTESPLEERVLEDLTRAGYRLEAQHQVGALRIDLVAHGEHGKRAAIECYGDKFHGLDQLDADLSRQATLERQGWRFVIIRGGSEYFRDPEATIAASVRT